MFSCNYVVCVAQAVWVPRGPCLSGSRDGSKRERERERYYTHHSFAPRRHAQDTRARNLAFATPAELSAAVILMLALPVVALNAFAPLRVPMHAPRAVVKMEVRGARIANARVFKESARTFGTDVQHMHLFPHSL